MIRRNPSRIELTMEDIDEFAAVERKYKYFKKPMTTLDTFYSPSKDKLQQRVGAVGGKVSVCKQQQPLPDVFSSSAESSDSALGGLGGAAAANPGSSGAATPAPIPPPGIQHTSTPNTTTNI